MLHSHLQSGIRYLLRERGYTAINLTGLAVSMACFLVIMAYVRYESTFDAFHENGDRIYRVTGEHERPGIGRVHNAVSPGGLGPALAADFSQIAAFSRVRPLRASRVRIDGRDFLASGMAMADSALLTMFSFPLVAGDPAEALAQPNSAVIDVETANRFFGEDVPLGRQFELEFAGETLPFRVTGVMTRTPENSHFSFRGFLSIETFIPRQPFLSSLGTNSLATYVLLRKGEDQASLADALPGFIAARQQPNATSSLVAWHLQPLKEIHLGSGHYRYQPFNARQNSGGTVAGFAVVAVLILIVSCINFTNLTTARAAKRAREIGIRKTLGSSRLQLIVQFIGESILLSFAALGVALVITAAVTPWLASFLGRAFSIWQGVPWLTVLQLAGVAVLAGILGGAYPAFVLSELQPVRTLKGSCGPGPRGARLRTALVIGQFTIAIVLMIGTSIFAGQMRFLLEKDLGFNQERVLYVQLRDGHARSRIEILRTAFESSSHVSGVSAAAGLRGAAGFNGMVAEAGTDNRNRVMLRYGAVDTSFLQVMGMEIVAGRPFSGTLASDSAGSIILNETAARAYGWDQPIGKQLVSTVTGNPHTVIGIVRDYHFFSLRQAIEPLALAASTRPLDLPLDYRFLLLRLPGGDVAASLPAIERIWNEHVPDRQFEYGFLDEDYRQTYNNERRSAALVKIFTGLAIGIACLGLLGLAALAAQQRTKEIGIRKVLGASVPGLAMLLGREFTIWVAWATVIAVPAAYMLGQTWLQDYAYRADLQPGSFLLGCVTVYAIALLTVSWQAIRAAVADPIQALKYE